MRHPVYASSKAITLRDDEPSFLTLSTFSPSDVANLAVWFDSLNVDGQNNATLVDGQAISQWNDLSGNGFHVSQAVGAKQPLFRVNQTPNNKPAISFDGTRFLSNPAIGAVGQRYTTFVVARVSNALNNYNGLVAYGNIYHRVNQTTGKQNVDVKSLLNIGTGLANQFNAIHLLESTGDWTQAAIPWNFYADGIADGNGTTAGPQPNLATTLWVGTMDGLNELLNGIVAGILVYSRILSNAERVQVEAYLRTRFGTP